MSETRTPARTDSAAGDSRAQALRQLGSRAHQLRATTRASDHFINQGGDDAVNTASWLMSAALDLAAELAADIDGLARSLKEQPDAALDAVVPKLRVLSHQLQAAAKAADHFLDQEGGDFQDTGSWLIATASGLAGKLAADIDNAVTSARRLPDKSKLDKSTIEPHDPQFTRRVAAATTTARGG